MSLHRSSINGFCPAVLVPPLHVEPPPPLVGFGLIARDTATPHCIFRVSKFQFKSEHKFFCAALLSVQFENAGSEQFKSQDLIELSDILKYTIGFSNIVIFEICAVVSKGQVFLKLLFKLFEIKKLPDPAVGDEMKKEVLPEKVNVGAITFAAARFWKYTPSV